MSHAKARTGSVQRRLLNRLRSGGVWVVAGRTAGMASVLVSLMFLTRAIGPGDFAAYVLAGSIVSLFSMAAMFGLNTLVCRYISESFAVGDAGRAKHATKCVVQLGLLTVATTGLIAWLALRLCGSTFFNLPALEEHAALIAIWVMLLAISQLIAEAFRGLHDLRMAGILAGVSGGLLSNVFFLVGVIATSFVADVNFTVIVIASIASLLLSTTIAAALFVRRLFAQEHDNPDTDHNLPVPSILGVVAETWPVVLTQVCGFGMSQMDIWVVGACCTENDLAVYGIARKLSLLVAVPLTQLSHAISSSIAELHARADKSNLQRVVRAAATVSAVGAGLPTVALMLFPGFTMGAIFGGSYVVGANTLQILLMGQVVFALTGPCGPALMMTGHQRMSLWSLLSVLPLFAVAPSAARMFGLEGVAAVFTVALTLQNLIQSVLVARLLGISTQPCFSIGYVRRLVRA